MASDSSIEDILRTAKKQEKSCDWLEVAKSYEQVLHSKSTTIFLSAEIQEKIGFCYSRASTQTKDSEEFRKLRQSAVEAYTSAARLFGKEDTMKNQGKSAQCNAIAEYLRSWLASSPSEKRKMLNKCLEFGKKSLKAYEKTGDELNYGKMCNDVLLCLLERLYVAFDWEEKRKAAQEGINCADKAISVLSKVGNKSELLRAYFTASLEIWYAANISEQEKKRGLMQRSLSYSEKALKLSREVDDPYYAAMANWAAAFCTLLFTEKVESSLEYAQEMLKKGIIAKDNYLKGVASYVLAFVTNWMIQREADADKRKKGHEKIIKHAEEAIHYLQLVSQDIFIADTCLYYAESYSSLARDVEASLQEKQAILRKAVEIGRRGLEHATRSGSPDATGSNLHALSKALYFYSSLEAGKGEKTRLLEEALAHRKDYNETVARAFPSNDWIRGVGKNYEGLIKAELARVETDKDRKRVLFESAVSDMDDGASRCGESISSHPAPTRIAALGRFQDWFGGILDEIYMLTEDKKNLNRAIEVYEDAAREFKKANLPSRVAESHWKMARNQDRLGKYEEAAKNFENAFTEYENAAQRTPHFEGFYLDYATYMKAWTEIERARFSSAREEYDQAQKHYEKAAKLLESSNVWKYLAPTYFAWALLKQGENQSRKNHGEKAIESFGKAANLFNRARSFLKAQLTRIQNVEEKDMALTMTRASQIRSEYCRGKIALEEAKMLDKEGHHLSSSQKYLAAAQVFEKLERETESETEREEFRPIICLCLAWQKMTLADAKASPELYMEASQLFEQTSERTRSERTRFLALGHSRFCKALEAGTRFTDTRDAALHSVIMQHLQSATDYYRRTALQHVAEYARATGLLFDAYVHMDNAKKEIDPEKRARLYMITEKILKTSAGSYLKAEQPTKMEQVQGLLTKVREERELAVALTEILRATPIVSSTPAFATPVKNEEKAVGLERFDDAAIETNLVLSSKQVKAGEDFNLEMQIANVGKKAALLTKVEEILPAGFDLVGGPDYCRLEDAYLDMKGKKLDPLGTEEVRFVLRSFDKGTFEIKPTIVYVDETGHRKLCEPKPVTLKVSKVVLPGRITSGYGDLDDLLFGGIPENYAVILTSPSCDEKDLLIKRFLEAGAKEGQTTFHVTIEASGVRALAEEFQSSFYLFICNPQADKIIKTLPNVSKLEGVENLTNINIALTSAFRKFDPSQKGSKRACIEIISDVLLQHHAVQTRRWLTALAPELKSYGFTTLAVMNPHMHPPREVQAILDLFEGEISIYLKDTQKGSEKLLRIEKMYNQKYLESEVPLKKESLQT
jgi:KaiC/GvpD/RAD55 family RecA-like ATPase/tetratricopeptide (TPR) repeat protein